MYQTQTASVLLSVLLVVGAATAFPFAGVAAAATPSDAPSDAPMDQHANDTNENTSVNVSSGERLTGVLGVQEAELDGEIERRTFGIKVANAATADAKAKVVAQQLNNVSERLQQLQQQREKLTEARENGTISEGAYQARLAGLSARAQTVRTMANESENASLGLPAEVLETNGVNVTAIRTLQERASNMTGPETAAVARNIAGANAGAPADRSIGENRTTDGGNTSVAIDRAESRLDSARSALDRAESRLGDNASSEAQAALDRARKQLSTADSTLSQARQAAEDGDDERALNLASEAVDAAQQATENTHKAIELARQSGSNRGGTDQGGSGQDGSTAGTDQGGSNSGSDGGRN